MDEMSLEHKQALMKTIQVLTNFIHKRKYSTLADNIKLRIITPIGEEVDIYTAAEAELYKSRMQSILDLEKVYSK